MNLLAAVVVALVPPQANSFGKYPVGAQPRALATADLDGDGRADAVTANFGGNSLSILLNDGAGGFLTTSSVGTSTQPKSLATGDFDGDGNADVIVLTTPGGAASAQLTLHAGDGMGGLGAPVNTNHGLNGESLEARDFNVDGLLDVAILDTSVAKQSWVHMHIGQGFGGFNPPTSWHVGQSLFAPTGFPTSPAAFGDENNDGSLDAISVSHSFSMQWHYTLWFYMAPGNGSGGFQPLQGSGLFGYTLSPPPVKKVDLADFDSDGTLDMYHPMGSILKGTGTALLFQTTLATLPSADTPGSIAAHHVSSDSKIDVVMQRDGSRSVTIFLANASGPPGLTGATTYLPCEGVSALAFADLDGDGVDDLLVADDVGNGVYRYLNNGSGQLRGVPALHTPSKFFADADYPHWVLDATAADFNLDGYLDLVTGSLSGLYIGKNLGIGGNPNLTNILTAGICDCESGDFDEDGNPDVVYADNPANLAGILRGKGDGTFFSPATQPVGFNPTDVAAGDFNLDGKLDIVTGNTNSSSLSILVNTGAGAFLPAVAVPTKAYPSRVDVGDFNGDGVSDLVVAARDANEVVGHSGNGVAGFGAAVTLLTCTKPIGVALADIDNNDLLDLVAVYLSTPSTTTLQPLLGNGAGAFTPQSTSSFDAGDKGPVNMALVDLCGIGRLDACLGAGGKPVLLVNDGAGRYQPKASLITILGLMDVGGGSNLSLPVDLNHDGRLDLVYSAVGGPSNKNQLAMAPTLPPPGVQSLSNGTPGCTGIHGIVADVKATSGRSFIVSSKNAPPSSLGLVLATDAVNLTGIDPFGLGILLFTDFFNSSYVAAYDVVSDRNGSAAALVDVPAAPSLVGQSLYTQLLFAWYGTGCTPSTYTLSSSRALVSTVFP